MAWNDGTVQNIDMDKLIAIDRALMLGDQVRWNEACIAGTLDDCPLGTCVSVFQTFDVQLVANLATSTYISSSELEIRSTRTL